MAYKSPAQVKTAPEEGLTLVEGMVAGFMSMIIVAVMYTFFTMSCQLVARGALNTKIQMQYQTMVEQMGRTARRASSVLGSDEEWAATIHAAPAAVTSIWMFDVNGNPIGGYRIAGAALQEWVDDDWKNFRVGNHEVTVPGGSAFSLADDRRSVTLDIAVVSSDRSAVDTALSQHEVFLCRN
jgi:hypothetical protein